MLLADYSSGSRCFELDPNTGVYAHVELPVPRKGLDGYAGVAQLLRSPGEGKVLVATYLLDGEPWLSIGADRWKFLDGSVDVTHRERFGIFLCELSLHQDGRCIRTLRYFRRDWFIAILDSTYDNLDFSLANLPVDFEPHGLSSIQKQREDFIAMWSSHSTPGTGVTP